jgi:hypothetical protein
MSITTKTTEKRRERKISFLSTWPGRLIWMLLSQVCALDSARSIGPAHSLAAVACSLTFSSRVCVCVLEKERERECVCVNEREGESIV